MNGWKEEREGGGGQARLSELLPQSTYRLIQAGFDVFQSSIFKHTHIQIHSMDHHQDACNFGAYAL